MASGKPSVDPKMATGESRAKKSAPEIAPWSNARENIPGTGNL